MLLRREMVSRRHWWKTSRVEGRGQKCWLRSFLCRGTSVERRGLLNARRAAERFGEGEGRNVGFAHFCVEGRASRVEGCVRRLSTLDSRRSANFCWPSPLGPRRSTASLFYDSGHGGRGFQCSVFREEGGERRDGTKRQILVSRHCFSDDPPSPVGVESERDGFAGNIGPTRFLVPIRDFFLGEFYPAKRDNPFIDFLDCCVRAQLRNKSGANCPLSERSSWI